MTTEQIMQAVKEGKMRYSHTSYFRGYISRKIRGLVEPYKGRFGNGYTIKYNDGTSNTYSRVAYYIFTGKGGEEK